MSKHYEPMKNIHNIFITKSWPMKFMMGHFQHINSITFKTRAYINKCRLQQLKKMVDGRFFFDKIILSFCELVL